MFRFNQIPLTFVPERSHADRSSNKRFFLPCLFSLFHLFYLCFLPIILSCLYACESNSNQGESEQVDPSTMDMKLNMTHTMHDMSMENNIDMTAIDMMYQADATYTDMMSIDGGITDMNIDLTWNPQCLLQDEGCLHVHRYEERLLINNSDENTSDWQWQDNSTPIQWQSIETITLSDEDAGNIENDGEIIEIQQKSMQLAINPQASSIELRYRGIRADRMLQLGYQSWSFSGAVDIPAQVPLDDENHLFVHEGRVGDSFYAEHGVSYNAIGGQLGDEGQVWLLAALDQHIDIQAFALQKDTSTNDPYAQELIIRVGVDQIRWGSIDTTTIAMPEHFQFVWITADTMWHALKGYQQLIQKQTQQWSMSGHPYHQDLKSIPLKPMGGWFSWNEHFEDIDEALILNHIDVVAQDLKPHGLTLVEMDDGWQQGWGIWESNEKFPNGIQPLVDAAHAESLHFGIWMAPFLVDVEVADGFDPSWFVHDQGQPLTHNIIGNPRTYYVLDSTHPEAMEVALQPLRLLSMMGVDFFKLDFLYAGALPGERTQAVTGSMALHLGLQKIRQAIGADKILNACGAPIHSVIGWTDSLRVGADTTFGELTPAFISWAARNLAARAYLYPLLWPDADQVQVRLPYSMMEAQVGAHVAALAGAAYSIGDDLVVLPTERREIVLSDAILNLSRAQPAHATDLMMTPARRIFANPLTDQIQNPNFTGAVPPSHFVTQDAMGRRWTISFDWNAEEFQVESMIENE